MKSRVIALSMGLLMVLAGCGGGGGNPGCEVGKTCTPGTETPASVTPDVLVLTLSTASVKNTDTAPVVATATVVNSSGQTIENVPVSFEVTGAIWSGGGVSDAQGKSIANINYSGNKDNRVVSVTAKAGSLTETKSFSVAGVKISATLNPVLVNPGSAGAAEFTVADNNSIGLPNTAISVSAPGFATRSGFTDLNGKYTYTYNVPSGYSSTSIVLTANAGGVSQQQQIAVQQGSTVISPAVGPIVTANLEVDPAVVETNTDGGSSNQTSVRLKVFNASALPIQNVRVSFDLEGDPLQVGGRLTSANSLVYTTSSGTATTTFIPGTKATGTDQLKIRACYSLTDFTPDPDGDAVAGSPACPAAVLIPMTINDEALNITIGSDDAIAPTADGLRYVVKYVVQVTNASGQAKPNVLITPTLDLPGYEKGAWTKGALDTKWTQIITTGNLSYLDRDVNTISYEGCANEDANRDGIRSGSGLGGEDKNSNTVLEPRKSDAAISFVNVGQNKTDETGAVALQVTYLKNVASWLRIKIYAKGAVSGTEGVGTFSEVLGYPASVIESEVTPAFAINPYGRSNSCNTFN